MVIGSHHSNSSICAMGRCQFSRYSSYKTCSYTLSFSLLPHELKLLTSTLKKAFGQGDWHPSLCDELLAAAWQQPNAKNLMLALDAVHSIKGVDAALIDRVDALVAGRLIPHWPLLYRLCSFDIALNRTAHVEARLGQLPSSAGQFFQHRAITQFPRVLHYLAGKNVLPKKLHAQAQIAEKLLKNTRFMQTTLNELIAKTKSPTVAVVGNGPSMHGSKAGQEIDAKDLVIRFNNTGINATYDNDLGKKTHLWVMSPNVPVSDNAPASSICAITGPDPWTRPSRYWKQVARYRETSTTFEITRWHALVSALSAPPSAGILMLDSLREAGIKPRFMNVKGFDRLTNLTSDETSANHTNDEANHYRDTQKTSSRHNWAAEAKLFQRWMKE